MVRIKRLDGAIMWVTSDHVGMYLKAGWRIA